MSKIDDVFGPIPGPLIAEWGQRVTFVRVDEPGAYNTTTGEVTTSEEEFSVLAVIDEIKGSEANGKYEEKDISILIDPGQIDDHYITTADYWIIPTPQGNQTARTVEVTTYRGDGPVFFECIARPQ